MNKCEEKIAQQFQLYFYNFRKEEEEEEGERGGREENKQGRDTQKKTTMKRYRIIRRRNRYLHVKR